MQLGVRAHSGQKGVLEEWDVAEEEQESDRYKHRRQEPPVLTDSVEREGLVLEYREPSSPRRKQIAPLHKDEGKEVPECCFSWGHDDIA